jgi:hypothetical protein
VFAVAFVADGQASVAGEPGGGACDLPPVPAQPVVPVDAAPGDTRDDALLSKPPAVDVVVVALVGVGAGMAGRAGRSHVAPRWHTSGADELGNADWWRPSLPQLQSGSLRHGSAVSVPSNLRVRLPLLICADAVRPSPGVALVTTGAAAPCSRTGQGPRPRGLRISDPL